MKKAFFGFFIITITLLSCKKEPAPPDVVIVPEKLELTPTAASVIIGSSTSFTVKYFNNVGNVATTPSNLQWTSNNTSIVTINNQGIATGVSIGQTEIKVTYNNISATALVNVVSNPNQLASILITPTVTQEILLNGTTNLSATGYNSSNVIINNLTFNWASNNAAVQVNAAGMTTGTAYGNANITATANSIQSAPLMVHVIRRGTLSGLGSTGTLKLKSIDGVIKLESSADFSVSNGAPDLRLYLTNTPNANSLVGSVQVVDLNRPTEYSGAHSWNMPNSVTMTNYRYVFVWCAQFGGNYGNCDLGL
jgi:hypothetical protein